MGREAIINLSLREMLVEIGADDRPPEADDTSALLVLPRRFRRAGPCVQAVPRTAARTPLDRLGALSVSKRQGPALLHSENRGAFEGEQLAFDFFAERIARHRAVRTDHPVAGHDQADRVGRIGPAHRAR